jgi:transposase
MPMLHTQIDAKAGAASNGGHRPTVVAAPASASPELSDRPRRRTFTARDKLRILAATDRVAKRTDAANSGQRARAAETGGIGAILRREGVYSSTLCDWRRQRDAGAFGALSPAKRGPKTTEPNPLVAEVAVLQRNVADLTRSLARAEAIIQVQKKTCGPTAHPDGAERRRALTEAVVAVAPTSGMTAAVCAALGVSRATVHRKRERLTPPPAVARPRPRPPVRALTVPQQQTVLDLLHAPRFADQAAKRTDAATSGQRAQAPAEIYATLLDKGVYRCSIRTMYRILDRNDEVRERRQQRSLPLRRRGPSGLSEAGTSGGKTQRGLVLGHHQTDGANEVELLLSLRDPVSLRDPGYLQPPRGGLVRGRC